MIDETWQMIIGRKKMSSAFYANPTAPPSLNIFIKKLSAWLSFT